MFSGIVRSVGRLLERTDAGGDARLSIGYEAAELGVLEPGSSIAINGACLTATASRPDHFEADVSTQTLSATTFATLTVGSRLNLEPSLRVGDPVDGHLVSGHVDGVGRVVEIRPAARSTFIAIELPAELSRYVARKGSIAVDGVSLTVNAVSGRRFEVNIVPYTSESTVISGYEPGTAVNIEIDMIARYLERLGRGEKGEVSLELLRSHGYAGGN
ncbi:riboflavin synthase [Candidatus Rariloculus sp.]|uniref:riboflavin synthase n=1 Tax=Candidatus Rariloculus sp. TaxID=3101265 RepID=UPI003D0A0D46